MPACQQHMASRAACSRPPSLGRQGPPLPPLAPAPSLASHAGGAAAARRPVVTLAQRYTGRSTAQQQQPADPNRRMRARRRPAGRRSREVGHESSSEFSAELFVLFGLPALVLVLSYAFNEPTALLISIPILMLIPGIRDVLLLMVVDGIRAARNGWRFVSLDSQDLSDSEYERPPPAQQRAEWREAQAERAAQAWRQAQAGQPPPPAPPPPPVWQAQQQPEWGRRVRTPPPPPPPEYELQPGEYSVLSPAASGNPRSPFADGWPEEGAFCDLPHSPFAPDWQAHLGQPQPQPQAYAPQRPFRQQQQQSQAYAQQPYPQQQKQQQQQGGWPAATPLAGAGAWQGEAPAAAAERVAASRRRRASRSRTTTAAAAAGGAEMQRAAAAAPSGQAGRLVRPARKGRMGVDIGRERDTTPLLLRPLFALVPFLRYWGGFL